MASADRPLLLTDDSQKADGCERSDRVESAGEESAEDGDPCDTEEQPWDGVRVDQLLQQAGAESRQSGRHQDATEAHQRLDSCFYGS